MRNMRLSLLLPVLLLAPASALATPSVVDSLPRAAYGAQGFGRYSPGGALAIGVLATLTPTVLAAMGSSRSLDEDFGWELPLLIGGTAGVWVGPAVGLASGGRRDLAGRGLLVRTGGLLVAAGGLFGAAAIASGDGEEVSPGAKALFGVGLAGAAVTAVSAIYDLGATPSAVARGRQRPHAALAVRPDGALAIQVKF